MHSDDRNAVRELAFELPDAEAEDLLGATLEKHPNDAVLYALRGMVRRRAGQIATALADYEKSASLEPWDPERGFSIASVVTDFVTKHPELSADEKRALLARAMEALGRVENQKQNDGQAAWAAYHRGAVLREQAKLESDPARRKARDGGRARQHCKAYHLDSAHCAAGRNAAGAAGGTTVPRRR